MPMPTTVKLNTPVEERPLSEWSTIAVELLGSQSRIVEGRHWKHHVIEAGEGPPLFLYHGVGGHAETYARTLPALAKHFHVYAAEALFHAHSSKEGFGQGPGDVLDVMADGVIDLADALGHAKFHFEGESMGGAIGAKLAFRYPERIDRLVVNGFVPVQTDKTFKVNPSRGDLMALSRAAVEDPTYDNIRTRLEWLVAVPDRIDDEMVAIRQRLYQDPEINAAMRQVFGMNGGDGKSLVESSRIYLESDFDGFTVGDRTLVLWGEANPRRGYDYAEYLADLIGAQFYGMDDCGHWPQWERPDEYAAVLTQFFLEG
jgi:pimeloyl-ACP methyl ester carboxylesterase